MKKTFLFSLALLLGLAASAQTAQHKRHEINLGIGAMGTDGGQEEMNWGATATVDYGWFFAKNFGVRGGVSYTWGMDEDMSIIGVPVAFCLRTSPDRSTAGERIAEGVEGFANRQDAGERLSDNIMSSIFEMLPFRAELDLGFTPGYVIGHGSQGKPMLQNEVMIRDVPTNNIMWPTEGNAGVNVRRHFYLTADASLRLTFNLSRLTLSIVPQYHYLITHNFERCNYDWRVNGKGGRRHFFGGFLQVGWLF